MSLAEFRLNALFFNGTLLFLILLIFFTVELYLKFYYVEDSFKSLTSNRPIEFSLIHFNTRSLRKHFNDIICHLTALDFHFDAIALSETFLNSNDDIELFALPGYHLPITLNRPNEDGGGGIALYISNDYNFKKREDLSYNSNETQFTFIEVERKKLKSLVGVTYKPPKTNVETYSNCLSEILDKLENSNKKCFVAGYFNIDLLRCETNTETNSFFNKLLTYPFFPTISKPTRITEHSATIIDNIYTNAYDIADDILSGNLYTDITDHLPVFMLQCSATYKKFQRKVRKRLFTANGEEQFKNELAMFDWSNIYDNDDSNMQYTHFTTAVTKLIDKHFPLKTIRMNYNTIRNPWITPGIIRSIKRKNKLYRAKLKNPTPKNTKKFRHYRSKLNHLVIFTKKNYYKSKLDKAQGDMRATWRIINEILNKKKSQPVHISNIVHNGKQFDKKIDIANQLNNFFTNIGPTLAKKCEKTQRLYKDWMKNTCSRQLHESFSDFSIQGSRRIIWTQLC